MIMFSINGTCVSDISPVPNIQINDINNIEISVNLKPIKNSQYCYNFITNSDKQNAYIVHLLNAMDLINDGISINGADIPTVNININKVDGSIKSYGFINGRFCDTDNKQYAVNGKEYKQFLDFIYALKTEKIILNDVTFEPSEWAKSEISQAIICGFVPKRNQINYQSNITRVEACQLFVNFLNKVENIEEGEGKSPFTDTNDPDVLMLYKFNIINGKSITEFCPYDFITREELAKMLSNTYHCIKSDTEYENNKNITFKDAHLISDWAIESVNAMESIGILIGNENGNFEPKRYTLKEELLLALFRLSNTL